MSYILRSHWCDIINLNVHDQTEDKIDDMKDSFYDELACVFDKFPKYHMSLLLVYALHGRAWCSCSGDTCCLQHGSSMYH
jgi:hypothetical protein